MGVKLGWIYGVILSVVCVSDARRVENTIDTTDDWSFVTRFCFLSNSGSLHYNFLYPQSYGTQEIYFYHDDPGQWEDVYRSDKDCSARRSVLSTDINQIVALNSSQTSLSRYSGCYLVYLDHRYYYNCSNTRVLTSNRQRWWYIAVGRCSASAYGNAGLKLEFKLHMTNGDSDDFWHHEYSADEFYILIVDIAFLVVYLLMLIASGVCAVMLKKRHLLHSTYKLYLASLVLWTVGLLFLCIAWGVYGATGWQQRPVEVIGRVIQASAVLLFLLMLILLAKGFSITRGQLSHTSTIRITVFFLLYLVVYAFLFLWEALVFNEGLVLYYYESPPGYGLMAMRLVGWLWLIYAIFFTLKHHPGKSPFYVPFFIFYTLWFWAGPMMVLVAMFALPKWNREKTVNGVEQFVGLCGHLFFLILTRPSAANQNFPYHVRTTQIESLVDPNDDSEKNSGQNYRLAARSDKKGGKDQDAAKDKPPPKVREMGAGDATTNNGPNLASLFVVQPQNQGDDSDPNPGRRNSVRFENGNNNSIGVIDEVENHREASGDNEIFDGIGDEDGLIGNSQPPAQNSMTMEEANRPRRPSTQTIHASTAFGPPPRKPTPPREESPSRPEDKAVSVPVPPVKESQDADEPGIEHVPLPPLPKEGTVLGRYKPARRRSRPVTAFSRKFAAYHKAWK